MSEGRRRTGGAAEGISGREVWGLPPNTADIAASIPARANSTTAAAARSSGARLRPGLAGGGAGGGYGLWPVASGFG